MLALTAAYAPRLLAVGAAPRPYPWRKGPRRLPFHLMVCSLDGLEQIEVDGRAYDIAPGGGYLIEAGALATIGSRGGNRPVFVHLDLIWDEQRTWRERWWWPDAPLLGAEAPRPQPPLRAVFGAAVPVVAPRALRPLLHAELPRAVEAWGRGDLGRLEAEQRVAGLLLAWVAAARAEDVDDEPARLARAEAAVLAQLDGDVDLAAFAAASGWRRARFCEVFRRHRGCPPGAWLREQRLLAAARLLAVGGLPIAEVGRRCGFAEVSGFARAFRRRFGHAPGATRRGSGDGQPREAMPSPRR